MKPITSHTPAWNFDMENAPLNRKLLALSDGVAVIAVFTQANAGYFQAWCPLPKIPKDKK